LPSRLISTICGPPLSAPTDVSFFAQAATTCSPDGCPEILVRRLSAGKEALIQGQFERGDISRITGLPGRSARRVLNDVVAAGLLASKTPKGAVSLRFPVDALELLFPRLFAEA
jgi:hypothetical protein